MVVVRELKNEVVVFVRPNVIIRFRKDDEDAKRLVNRIVVSALVVPVNAD